MFAISAVQYRNFRQGDLLHNFKFFKISITLQTAGFFFAQILNNK